MSVIFTANDEVNFKFYHHETLLCSTIKEYERVAINKSTRGTENLTNSAEKISQQEITLGI
jgi:hypothetical protein